jgi:hypothetical protein
MRRLLAFLVLAAAGWCIYQNALAISDANWRVKLERERGSVAEASVAVISGVPGAEEAARVFTVFAERKDKRTHAAHQDGEDAGTRMGLFVALAIVAFIVWVWPKSARATVMATPTTTTRAATAAAAAADTEARPTHRTPGRESDDGPAELGQGERIEFVTEAKGEIADIAATACQVCGEALESDVVTCESCRTPHHEECWEWNKGCTTYGCGERRFNRYKGANA